MTQNLPGSTIFIPARDVNGVPTFLNTTTNEIRSIPVGDPIPAGFVARGQSTEPFQEVFLGNSASPRVSIGIGVNWNSPFGPLRIDLAHAIKKEPGDDTKLFSFNVGTQF